MRDMNYQPNASARRLRRQHNHVLGMALAGLSGRPGIADLYFLELMRGVSIGADHHGYDLMVFGNQQRLRSLDFYRDLAAQHMIDGLIVAGSAINASGATCTTKAGLPTIVVGRTTEASDLQRIVFTWRDDVYRIVTSLLNLGHQRIGLFLNSFALIGERERLAGYEQALAERGIAYDPDLVRIAPTIAVAPLRSETLDLVERCRATAIVTAPYIEVCTYLDEAGAAPSVVVATLDEELHYARPQRVVAAARLAKYEAGLAAVDLIMHALRGQNSPAETVLPSLVTLYTREPVSVR
jgi:DNA-binding LacI/PurR family transcriptional regulator